MATSAKSRLSLTCQECEKKALKWGTHHDIAFTNLSPGKHESNTFDIPREFMEKCPFLNINALIVEFTYISFCFVCYKLLSYYHNKNLNLYKVNMN